MSLSIYRELEQGSDEWLQARCGLVTASTVGQLITPKTLRPAENDTSRSLLASLFAERVTGRPDPVHETWDMTRGTLSEPHARDLYAAHYEPVTETGFMRRDYPGFSIGYSPDGLTETGLIEIKSPRPKAHLRTLLTKQVPTVYLAQLHTGMLVADRPHIDYISYCPSLPLYVQRVERSEVWDRLIIDTVAAFEDKADEMGRDYEEATRGLIPTPYIDVFDDDLELQL